MGGALQAIKEGYIQKEIRRSAYNYQKAVDSGEQVVVGVNRFTTGEEPELELFEMDESIERKQIERLARVKRERDKGKVSQVLDEVRKIARTEENLMPVLIEAVKAYATVGEISDALRDVFGDYREQSSRDGSNLSWIEGNTGANCRGFRSRRCRCDWAKLPVRGSYGVVPENGKAHKGEER